MKAYHTMNRMANMTKPAEAGSSVGSTEAKALVRVGRRRVQHASGL